MKPKSRAALFTAARFIRFIKAVENVRDLILGDPIATVFNAHIGICVVGSVADLDIAVFVAELDGVLDQVIDHLVDEVRIGLDHDLAVIKATHLDTLFLKRLFKGKHRADDRFIDIEQVGLDL